jgi:hypothetical protein
VPDDTVLLVVTAPEIVKLAALLPTEHQWGVPPVDVHGFYAYTGHAVNNSEDKRNAVDISLHVYTVHVYTGN